MTIAKLHSSLGGCLHDMARYVEAAEQYGQAYDAFSTVVGAILFVCVVLVVSWDMGNFCCLCWDLFGSF